MDDWRTSVLMSVYHRADPSDFSRALESICDQTLPPDEVVVVEDGPLGPALEAVLDAHPGDEVPLVRVRLPENRGLAAALQQGLSATAHPWIVRMDADDVALPHRIETQMTAIKQGDIDVLGSSMLEFEGDTDHIVGTRSLPLRHDAISSYARINNPVNHPTAVLRRAAVEAVGGYRSVHHMEDYDLFARLLAAGYQFRNLAEPLLLFRSGEAMFDRRSARGMFRAEQQMQRHLVAYRLVSRPRSWANLLARSAFRALPRRALRRTYGALFYRARPPAEGA